MMEATNRKNKRCSTSQRMFQNCIVLTKMTHLQHTTIKYTLKGSMNMQR